MILWINLVTNGLPALALGVDPPDPTQMRSRRARRRRAPRRREYLGIAVVGVLMGGLAIACYVWPWTWSSGVLLDYARAMAFSLLALCPLFHAFNCRSATASILALKPMVSMALALGITVSAAIHLVSVLVPTLRPVFRTYPMAVAEWALLLLLSASIVPAFEGLKLLATPGNGREDHGTDVETWPRLK